MLCGTGSSASSPCGRNATKVPKISASTIGTPSSIRPIAMMTSGQTTPNAPISVVPAALSSAK